MNRVLLRSNAFIRAAKKIIKRDRGSAAAIEAALELLATDTFHRGGGTGVPPVRTGGTPVPPSRIVFSFVQHQEAEAILLETMGTHDEVY